MAEKNKPQTHMDDTIIKDPDLERMLEERQELKETVSQYTKLSKEIKTKLAAIETPTPYRIGRFIISRNEIPGKTVSFEVQSSFRFNIKLAGEG